MSLLHLQDGIPTSVLALRRIWDGIRQSFLAHYECIWVIFYQCFSFQQIRRTINEFHPYYYFFLILLNGLCNAVYRGFGGTRYETRTCGIRATDGYGRRRWMHVENTHVEYTHDTYARGGPVVRVTCARILFAFLNTNGRGKRAGFRSVAAAGDDKGGPGEDFGGRENRIGRVPLPFVRANVFTGPHK